MERAGSGPLTLGEELSALLLLRLVPGVGDRTLLRLVRAAGSAAGVLALPDAKLEALAAGNVAAARRDRTLTGRVNRVQRRCRDLGIRIVPFGDPSYPAALLALSDPPPVLFLRGDVGLLDRRSIAVVGSRRATPVGRRVAERFGRELSEAGIAVVSGLAFGIDGAAHRGALRGPGGTIAVLGRGPDRAHPPGNRDLFDRVLRGGLVVSEFPPEEPARPFHFPRRNRVLAALSRAVVVVEAARRSGALITVDHALDLGLEVFAVPGSVETPQAEGANRLLRDGAHVLTDVGELLEVMGWDPVGERRASPAGRPEAEPGSAERTRLSGCLGTVPRSLEQLVMAAHLPAARVLSLLTALEMEGVARREPAGWTATIRREPGA